MIFPHPRKIGRTLSNEMNYSMINIAETARKWLRKFTKAVGEIHGLLAGDQFFECESRLRDRRSKE